MAVSVLFYKHHFQEKTKTYASSPVPLGCDPIFFFLSLCSKTNWVCIEKQNNKPETVTDSQDDHSQK